MIDFVKSGGLDDAQLVLDIEEKAERKEREAKEGAAS